MSTIGAQPLPEALVYFLVATEGLDPPEPARRALALLRDICDKVWNESTRRNRRKPRDVFNRRIGQARRWDAEQFLELAVWADSEEVGNACYWTGDYWRCLQAFTQIYLGTVAHAAFGMSAGGSPQKPGFTLVDDAVFRAERLIQRGMPVGAALEQGCKLARLGQGRWREAERQRAAIRDGASSGLILIDPFATKKDDVDDDSPRLKSKPGG